MMEAIGKFIITSINWLLPVIDVGSTDGSTVETGLSAKNKVDKNIGDVFTDEDWVVVQPEMSSTAESTTISSALLYSQLVVNNADRSESIHGPRMTHLKRTAPNLNLSLIEYPALDSKFLLTKRSFFSLNLRKYACMYYVYD